MYDRERATLSDSIGFLREFAFILHCITNCPIFIELIMSLSALNSIFKKKSTCFVFQQNASLIMDVPLGYSFSISGVYLDQTNPPRLISRIQDILVSCLNTQLAFSDSILHLANASSGGIHHRKSCKSIITKRVFSLVGK
jgi:hypothetical protein